MEDMSGGETFTINYLEYFKFGQYKWIAYLRNSDKFLKSKSRERKATEVWNNPVRDHTNK